MLFDEPLSLRRLPQQVSVVVGIVLRLTVSGRHPGDRASVNRRQQRTDSITRTEEKLKQEWMKEIVFFFYSSSSSVVHHVTCLKGRGHVKYGNGFVGLFALGWTGTQKAGVTLELFSRILNQKIDQKKSEGWTLGYFTPDCPWWLLITGIKKHPYSRWRWLYLLSVAGLGGSGSVTALCLVLSSADVLLAEELLLTEDLLLSERLLLMLLLLLLPCSDLLVYRSW